MKIIRKILVGLTLAAAIFSPLAMVWSTRAASVMPVFTNDTTATTLSFNDTFGHQVVMGSYDPATGLWTTLGAGGGTGTVTNVTWTGGIVSIATPTSTPAFTIAGTSGGVPYFSTASAWTSSGVLGLNGVVIGGGSGGAPTSVAAGNSNQVLHGNTGAAPSFSGLTSQDLYQGGSCSSGQAFYNNAGVIACSAFGPGTVTSVSWAGGIVSIATPTSTPAFTISGTSGGIPYFSSGSAWASSTALALNGVVLGGGAGGAPKATSAGTSNQLLHGVTGAAPSFSGLTSQDLYQGGACPSGQGFYNNAGAIACQAIPVGTVTSVGQTFTGGLISVGGSPIIGSGVLALTVAGTSGGVPYFSSGSAWASSGLLAANGVLIGGGAGAPPSSIAAGSTNQVLHGITSGAPAFSALTTADLFPTCPAGQVFYNNAGAIGCLAASGSGTVTSVNHSFTGGLISATGGPVTTTGTLALTVAGTSGGIPYFSSGTTWATSAALASGQLVQGGGAGAAPSTFALGGDCTFSTPNITCTKTGGTALGTFATQNYATPPPIGGTTPAALAGTTVSSTGQASLNTLAVNAAGMVGDGVTSNNTVFSALWSGLASNGGYIKLPCGVFKVSGSFAVTLASQKHLMLAGSGTDCTELYFSGTAAGLSVTYGGAFSGVSFRDMTITTDDSTGVNTAISLTNTAATWPPGVNEFVNLTMRGHDGYGVANYWGTGVSESGVAGITFERFTCQGAYAGGTCVNLQSPNATAYSFQINFIASSFYGTGTGIVYGNFVQVVNVISSVFASESTAAISSPAGMSSTYALNVLNCQFYSAGILETTSIPATTVMNSIFSVPASGTAIYFGSATANNYSIVGNYIHGANTTNDTGINFAVANTGQGGNISANTFYQLLNAVNYAANTIGILTNNVFTTIANIPVLSTTMWGWGNQPETLSTVAGLPACAAATYGLKMTISNGVTVATLGYQAQVGAGTSTIYRNVLCMPTYGWVYN